MELSVAEGRVLGCLIEKQVTESDDTYSLSLDELRFSCNQTSGRDPVVAFDDRTVEDTVLSLKAMGLARFVTVGHRAGPLTYRHRADERWRLGRPELAVFAVLLLRGPQTVEQIWKLLGDQSVIASPTAVEVALDTLAGRTPTPLAARLARSDGPGGVSWVEVLTGRFTLDPPRTAAYDPAPAMPSRRGSGLPAREPWRPDERFDARPRQDPRDVRNRREVRDERDPRDRGAGRPGPGPGGQGPERDRDRRRDDVPDAPPLAVPADEPAGAPALGELADRLTGIERRLAAIEAALDALHTSSGGGGGGVNGLAPSPQQPHPQPHQPPPPQQGRQQPPPRQQGQPPRPAPSRPRR